VAQRSLISWEETKGGCQRRRAETAASIPEQRSADWHLALRVDGLDLMPSRIGLRGD